VTPTGQTDAPFAHGYTVADLDHVARKAGSASRWLFLPLAQRIDLARFAITEHLLTCDQPPDFWNLVNIGEKAITAHVDAEGRYRGVYLSGSRRPSGTPMPRFWRYWLTAAQPTRSPEDPIVEATALAQIFPRLSRPHQRVLLALAEYDDYDLAAQALGRQYHGFVSTLHTARQQFLRLWHEHETPSRFWGRDRRNRDTTNAHSITTTTIRRRQRRRAAANLAARSVPPTER
jgi:hypothetical protein